MKTFKQFLNEKITNILAYHGSPVNIDEFRYEFTNKGNDQLGSGFYFTTDKNEALGYGKNIHTVELTFKKLLDADKDKPKSNEHRLKISKANKGKMHGTGDTTNMTLKIINSVWINNGVKSTRKKDNELEKYLANGWVLGRLKWANKDV